MTELVVDPGELSFVDVLTSSHNHTDHLDADTLVPILARNPKARLVIPEANRSFVRDRLKIDPTVPIGLDDGKTVELCGIQFSGVAAAHETIERNHRGCVQSLGYVLRFGNWGLYHSGDTVRYEGMAERLRTFAVDVALLPINGRSPERRVAGNLSGAEAALLAHDIGAKLAIPCHFEMFEFNTAPPDQFIQTCQRVGQCFTVLRCGERFNGKSKSLSFPAQ
jgi:L-ascorbate metabolism protein UlaG (beta-lactamase superfamily)